MEVFDQEIKKFAFYFPHLPLPVIEKFNDSYTVHIFNSELEIKNPNDLDIFIDSVVKIVSDDCIIKNENLSKKSENIISTVVKQSTQTVKSSSNNAKNRESKNRESKNKESKNRDYKNNNYNKDSNNKQSARGKMKIKNIQNNRYIPTYQEDTNVNHNNILTEFKETFSEKILKYCKNKNIAYPEFVFEKSNGVYLCRAIFMKEKFESRYAYDMNVAKEDASSLIYTFIKYQETNENYNKKVRLENNNKKVRLENNYNVQNTNYSEMFGNNENTFDIGKFLQYN